MKKRYLVILATVLLSALAAGCGKSEQTSMSTQAAATKEDTKDTHEIVISHIVDENHSWHKGALKFKEVAEKESGGRIHVTIYPNNQLGSEVEVIQSMLTGGGCDITFTGESLQTYKEELGIIGMPYAIRSDEHMQKVLEGEVGKELEEIMLDCGLRSIGYFVRGPRNITSNKPIKTSEDLKGFIIRTPQSPMTVAAFEAMGAKPTPMAFGEVFTSLQQGVISGQENPLAMIRAGSFYEVQKYVNESEHLRAWVYAAMSEQKFQSLPEDLQQVVIRAGKEMQAYEHDIFLEEEKVLKSELEEKGMEFSSVDKDELSKKAIEGVLSVLTDKQRALYEKIKAVE